MRLFSVQSRTTAAYRSARPRECSRNQLRPIEVYKWNIPRVRGRLLKVLMAQFAISAVTEAELLFGAARKPEAVQLKVAVEEFLFLVEALPWDSKAARHYAEIRATLERHGKPELRHDDRRTCPDSGGRSGDE